MVCMYVHILCHNLPMCFSLSDKHPQQNLSPSAACFIAFLITLRLVYMAYEDQQARTGICTTCDVPPEMWRYLGGALGLNAIIHYRPKNVREWNSPETFHTVYTSMSLLTVFIATSLSGFLSDAYISGLQIHSCWSRTRLDIVN